MSKQYYSQPKMRTGYSYSYQDSCVELQPGPGPGQDNCDSNWIIQLKLPRVSSFQWMLKLYSLVMGGLGIILSLSWTCFHVYVLSVTSLPELRQHRYLDISLGLVLLISMLSLLYGSYALHPSLLVIFFTLSLAVLIVYWIWYFYANFLVYPVMFEEQIGKIGCILTFIYLGLLMPIIILYRDLHSQPQIQIQSPDITTY